MLVRTALILGLAAAMVTPLSAEPASTPTYGASLHAERDLGAPTAPGARRIGDVILWHPRAIDDIHAGHGPDPDASVLRRIAIANAIGNRDAADILTARLRAQGTSRDRLDRAIHWTAVHAAAPGPARPRLAPAAPRPASPNSEENAY